MSVANFYSGGLLQIVPHYQVGDRVCANVMWVKGSITGPVSSSDMLTLANDLQTAWSTFWKTSGNSTASLKDVTVTDFSSSAGLSVVSTGAAVAGSGASGAVPANVAILLSLKVTSERYRGGHSRIYLPGLDTSQILGFDTISTTVAGQITTRWNTWVSHLSTGTVISGGLVPVVLHRRRHIDGVLQSPSLANVTSVTVQTRLASQRRRLRAVTRS